MPSAVEGVVEIAVELGETSEVTPRATRVGFGVLDVATTAVAVVEDEALNRDALATDLRCERCERIDAVLTPEIGDERSGVRAVDDNEADLTDVGCGVGILSIFIARARRLTRSTWAAAA
jgi:2-polyprenyl-3-methyl-5-hydroxy-6-metoxy-1,4-benzoquinol methylase